MRGAGQRKLRAPAMRWALATAAPWALATGMLVSFTASAGQPNDVAISLQARAEPDVSSDVALGPSLLTVASAFNLPALSLSDALVGGRYEQARLSVEEPARLVPMNERRPRADLKPNVAHFPELDRSRKSDPLLSLRPSLSQRQQPMEPRDLDRFLFDGGHGGLSARFVPDGGAFPQEPQRLEPQRLEPEPLEPSEAVPDPLLATGLPATDGGDASPATASDLTPGAFAPRRATPVLPSAVWKALMAPRQ